MSAFRLHTLKQKLWAIVLASFVARVIMFFALPSTASFLAPDEGTYAFLTKWIGESKSANEFPLFGKGLYLSGRSIIIPASVLYRAGLHELDAVRITASLYGLFALALIVFIILKVYNSYALRVTNQEQNEKLITLVILVFAFLPSHFLWSCLGLRESATEFWLLTTFISFFVIFHQQKEITIPSLILFTSSIVLTFSARPQVGWVLGVTLVTYLFFNLRNNKSYFILPTVLCAVVLGSILNLGSPESIGSTSATNVIGTTSTTESNPGSLFNPLLNAGEIVEYKQEVNQLDAASAIETQSCPREEPTLIISPPTKFDTYFCIAWRAPYMVSTFLFRPILGVDVTSTSSIFAAFENIFWITFFATIFGLLVWRRQIAFLSPLIPTVIFLCLYVLGASSYQGNMGTGFRHKSLILWAVLLIIFALAWRKPEGSEESAGSNSQENAV